MLLFSSAAVIEELTVNHPSLQILFYEINKKMNEFSLPES